MFFVDKVLKFVLKKVKQKISTRQKQATFLMLMLLFYFHSYYFIFIRSKESLYTNLKIKHRSSSKDIRKLGRKILRSLHPDKVSGKEKEYLEAEQAFSILNGKSERWLYDRFNPEIKSFSNSMFFY